MTMKQLLETLADRIDGMDENSAFGRYIAWLNERFEQKDELFLKDYQPIVEEEEPYRGERSPFLSIVTRTQGKRPEMIRETLLSLCAQTDMDFELVLIGHKVNDGQAALMEAIIREQPQEMQERIRFLRLDHGTRTTPINFGFAHARGRYIAVLDDDDIVLDNWVEEFHRAAEKRSGAILHAYVFTQEWITVETEQRTALRASAAPQATYCKNFDFLRQVRENYCPLIGLAFPAFYFQKLGVIFDEKLTTTEDWDYLMRLAFFAGIEDIETATSLYRLWQNAENSATLHNRAEWNKNYLMIQDKIMDRPILVPQGNRKSVAEESILAAIDGGWFYRTPRITKSYMYLNRGAGFTQMDSIEADTMCNGFSFDTEFQFEPIDTNGISEVRFDVCEEGLFVIEDVLALVTFADGDQMYLTIEDCRCNGAKERNAICFLKGDPWMIWSVPVDKTLKTIRIIGKLSVNMTQNMIREACQTIAGAPLQLYYATPDSGFSEKQSLFRQIPNGSFSAEFSLNGEKEITSLRFDPGDDKGCAVSDMEIELYGPSGTVKTKITDKQTNGVAFGDRIAFLNDDPQIILSVGSKKLDRIRISGVFSNLTDEEMVQAAGKASNLQQLIRKGIRKISK